MTWPFADPENVLVFTSRDIVQYGMWVHYVSHDAGDGAWQFHSVKGAPVSESDARVVLLKNIVAQDPSLLSLADLPIGWCAWREAKESLWRRPSLPDETLPRTK